MIQFDPTEVRSEFPAALGSHYLNTARKGPLSKRSSAALTEFALQSSAVGEDRAAWLADLETARIRVAALLQCRPAEIAFCKNTSEGLNAAANAIAWKPGDNVVVPSNEHPNNLLPWLNLKSRGVEVRVVPVADQYMDADSLAGFVDRRTRAIALSHVSSRPGQRNDIDSIAALALTRGVLLIIDAVQSLGLLDWNVSTSGVSLVAAGVQKGLLAPHGLGILYCRSELVEHLVPRYVARSSVEDGWAQASEVLLHSDARRFEYGNPAYACIQPLNESLDLLMRVGMSGIEDWVLGLARHLDAVMSRIGLVARGPSDDEHRSTIREFDVPGEDWEPYLCSNRIIVSAYPGTIRVSLHVFNNRDDIDALAEAVAARLKHV